MRLWGNGHNADWFWRLGWRSAGEATDEGEVRNQQVTISRVCGLVWNCTNIMPGIDCAELGLLAGSTYAQGARRLKDLIGA